MNRWKGIFLMMSFCLVFACNNKFSDIFYRNGSKLVVNDVKFDYLSSKAKIDFESEKTSLSGTANIRIRKDSVIWVSLSPGLGIEVARILITRDSVSFIDKVNKEYAVYDFHTLSKKFDFDFNYGLVESVILGNLIYPYEREKVVKTTKFFAYNQQQGNFLFENFIGTQTMKLEKVQVLDTASRNSISVNYGDFQLVDEEVFPFRIDARITYKESSKGDTKVGIEYKQNEIEKKPLKFPFNIPQRYDRK